MDTNTLPVALGAFIGFLLALTGAGGGVLSIPLLVFGLQMSVVQAAPVGLLAVCAASALGAGLGLRERIVRYRAAILIGVIGMLMAPMGVVLAQHLPNRPMMFVFGLLLIYTASRTLLSSEKSKSGVESVTCRVSQIDHRLIWTRPCAAALAATGLVSGLLSGLLGVGGGFVIVPTLSRHTDLDIRSVQVTSLAVMAMVSLSGVCAAAWQGSVNWKVALPFASGAVIALLLGRRLAGKLRPAHLQQVFAWFCLTVALLMLGRAMAWLPN
jgi:uncharacterized membrane protein YfcA